MLYYIDNISLHGGTVIEDALCAYVQNNYFARVVDETFIPQIVESIRTIQDQELSKNKRLRPVDIGFHPYRNAVASFITIGRGYVRLLPVKGEIR